MLKYRDIEIDISISILEQVSIDTRLQLRTLSHKENKSIKEISKKHRATILCSVWMCVRVCFTSRCDRRRHFSQLARPYGRPIRRSSSRCSRISPSRSNLSIVSVTRAVSLLLPSASLLLTAPLSSFASAALTSSCASSPSPSSVNAALFLCRVVRTTAPFVSSSPAYIVFPSLPPSLFPLFSLWASLSLPLKSAASSCIVSRAILRAPVCIYGRLQVSRMQAIKCVVVGDGYVIRRGSSWKTSLTPKFEQRSVSGENSAEESVVPGLADDDRRERIGLPSGERQKRTETLAIASIAFPRCASVLSRASPPRPCGIVKTTLTCTRVFSRGRHIYFFFPPHDSFDVKRTQNRS